jgi:hypothetical protein
MQVFQPAGAAEGNQLPQLFRYGPLQLRPHVSYSMTYGNGIQNAPGEQQKLIIQQLSPGLHVDMGPHWTFDYTPTFEFYSSDKFQDTMNQAFALTGGVGYEAWQFGLSHSTQVTSAPMVQTGEQTDTQTHATTLSATRVFSSSLSADFSLNQNITLVSGFDNSYDWDSMDWINYQFWPRLNVGLGGGGGYVLVQNNGNGNGQATTNQLSGNLNQTYEQLQGRLNWRATDRISFQVSGGLEDRQFQMAGESDSLVPIFSAAIQYQPFKKTQISVTASQGVTASDFYILAQQVETTTVAVNLSQQLWRQFQLGLGLAYSQTAYSESISIDKLTLAAVNRTDDLYTFTAQLSHPFYKRGTWSVFYEYSEDSSSTAGFSYKSSQMGMSLSYAF